MCLRSRLEQASRRQVLVELFLSAIVVLIAVVFKVAEWIALGVLVLAIGVVLVPVLLAQGVYLEVQYIRRLLS